MAFSISDLRKGNCLVSLILSEVLIQMEMQDLFATSHTGKQHDNFTYLQGIKEKVLYKLVSHAVMNCLGSLNLRRGRKQEHKYRLRQHNKNRLKV